MVVLDFNRFLLRSILRLVCMINPIFDLIINKLFCFVFTVHGSRCAFQIDFNNSSLVLPFVSKLNLFGKRNVNREL